jgi:DNA polymerase-3 subunit beta
MGDPASGERIPVKFQVNRDVFSEAVTFAVKLLPSKFNHPVLGGVLIESSDNGIVLSSFDYEASATTKIAAAVGEPGRMLVSGRLLADIASRLPDAPVVFSTQDSRVVITCGKASFTLLSMPLEEYPAIPVVTGRSGKVPADVFADAVGQVAVAASREDVTPVITGVLVEVANNQLSLIATDRYRVAVRTIDWDGSDGATDVTALVPVRIIQEVSKTFANAGVLTITFTAEGERELISFSSEDKTVTSVLIRGQYPPIRRLFPESVENYAVVNTAELVEAVRRVKLVLERDIPIRFTFGQDGVMLDGHGGDKAQATENVDSTLTGNEMTVSLKPDFLLDGLNALHSEFARLGFTISEVGNQPKPGPVLITRQTSATDSDAAGFKYLLQPNLLIR